MFLFHRVNGVNFKMEAVSSTKACLKSKNKYWICWINLVFILGNNNNNDNGIRSSKSSGEPVFWF